MLKWDNNEILINWERHPHQIIVKCFDPRVLIEERAFFSLVVHFVLLFSESPVVKWTLIVSRLRF